MFPAMYTHYYWEEKREEIYGSAPSRRRVCRGRTGGRRRWRRREEREETRPECLSHGPTWCSHMEQLTKGLCGRVLPSRGGFAEQLAATVCSCDDRDREKCRRAAAGLGFTAGSNLPPLELNDRMRFNELYFHNILNSPQFTSEYIDACGDDDPVVDVVRGLHAARTAIFALVQRCVLGNDLKAYRFLDIIRLYTQKPNNGSLRLPLPAEQTSALEMLCTLEKGDHMNVVAKLFGCQIVLGFSNEASPPMLELSLSTANLDDIKGVEEYFQKPLGYKEPEPVPVNVENKPEGAGAAAPADTSGNEGEETANESQNHSDSFSNEVNTVKNEAQQQQKEGNAEQQQASSQGEGSARAETTEQSVSAIDKSNAVPSSQHEAASGAGAVSDPSDAATKTNTDNE